MSVTLYRLDEVVQGIHDGIVAALDAALGEDELLHGIAGIIPADRANPMPDGPALWTFPGDARNEHADAANRGALGRFIREKWTFEWHLVAMVLGYEPNEDRWKAITWASKAQEVVLRERDAPSRPLGLPYVVDVRSGDFEPNRETDGDRRQLYWARTSVLITAEFYRGNRSE